MKFGSEIRVVAIALAFSGMSIFSSSAQAQVSNDGVPYTHTSVGIAPYCGDGRIDGEEICDEGEANGSPDSLCTDNCNWNIPDDECVEEAFEDCLDEIPEPVGVVVLVESDDKAMATPPTSPGECLERAKQECEEPEPSDPPADVPPPPLEDKPDEPPAEIVPEGPTLFFEGSGCSLAPAGATANLGILLGLALGLVPLSFRRKK